MSGPITPEEEKDFSFSGGRRLSKAKDATRQRLQAVGKGT